MIVEAVRAQVQAARPGTSSWVSANAGSGKTRVLTDRVARLLLAGTAPERILCLTYTKAAAAEMQNRLFRTLGDWAMRDDAALREALDALGEPAGALPPEALSRARTLFARALETPGGLKIQTIHAFCEALLRRFPLEAGVAPQFAVLDDRQARELRAEVLDELTEARPGEFAALARLMNGDDPDLLLQEIGHNRPGFARTLGRAEAAEAFGVDPGLTPDRLAAELLTPAAEATIRALMPRLASSGKTDAEAAEALAAVLAETRPMARLEALEKALLTGEGTPRKNFPAKAVRIAMPQLCEAICGLARQVAEARPQRLALPAIDAAVALNRFGRLWIDAFGARKRALGRLDFDDMIDRAQELLERPGTAAWVLWRLDGGIDHILVDEAQDTSPAQWRVIQALTGEFFAGEGARAVDRTIFVVGDEKQSIYSFQGADPDEFGLKNREYAKALDDLGRTLEACSLLYSFRSARPILELVDRVFSGRAGEGLSGEISHRAIDTAKPGRVELWPYREKPEKAEERPWHEPADAPPPADPVEEVAGQIADEIGRWIAEAHALPGEARPRPIRAGDVMILVQRRGPMFDAVIRSLKRKRVPVAGADLLRIGGELAVRDLLAALRVAATPQDDLSLAAVLRSPLGGMSERELFELAHSRDGRLWPALRAAPPGAWRETRALIEDLQAQADFLRPFELIQRMLVRHQARRKLVARLGAEAEDGIDALLDQALAYEQVEPPSLTGFLDWIDRAEVTAKRRTEEGADQVRVMTVHGAKGLEAPIVILPDTGPRQDHANAPQVLRLGHGRVAWRGRTEQAPPAITAAEAARRALVRKENRRLLYVALTRAQRWLIVCGAGPALTPGAGESWHALVADAMTALGAAQEPEAGGDRLVLTHNWDAAAAAARAGAGLDPAPLPAWTRSAMPRPRAAAPALSPSALGGELALPAEAAPGGLSPEAAKARGTALHRLLEHLHGRPATERARLAARLLPGAADLPELVAEAALVLDAPELAFVFGPGSRAEVEVTAPLPGGRLLGRIDRLVVEAGRVLAIDFKSNRAVPATAGAMPEGILRQLGAYRAALRLIWPDRRVETAVLWTRAGRLMPLPDALVDAAFARLADLDPAGVGS